MSIAYVAGGARSSRASLLAGRDSSTPTSQAALTVAARLTGAVVVGSF